MAYSITYTSVTWTVGDVITETKLDNMVANDQAYDAHSSEGYQVDNNVGYGQKDSGGTRRTVVNVDASNVATFGNASLAENAMKTICKFAAYRNSNQSIADATLADVQFDVESYDIGSDYNTGTYTFTAPVTGYYYINAGVRYDSAAADSGRYLAIIVKNGTQYRQGVSHASVAKDIQAQISAVMALSATDTVKIQGFQESGVSKNIEKGSGSGGDTYFEGHLLSV